MPLNPRTTPALLRELNDALSLEGAGHVDWIVCGGTALALKGMLSRTTQDVDVIAAWSASSLDVIGLRDFPPAVERAIDRVAAAHPELRAAGKRWVNLGPRRLLEFGLPAGCTRRLRALSIGPSLTLQLPDRIDLIAFKLFAAIDPRHERQPVHKGDFEALGPTEAELRFAIDWVLTIHDPNQELRTELREFLLELGHDDHAYNLN